MKALIQDYLKIEKNILLMIKAEFFIQLIPYLLLLDLFIFPSKLKNFLSRKFILLSLFIGFCFLSLSWTDNLKYTLASNLELLTTSITTIVVAFYIERNEKGIENINFPPIAKIAPNKIEIKIAVLFKN